ncbi:hypothetical protein AKO1_000157, partial [Acrasis kona]
IELYNIETKKQKNVTKIQSQPEKQFNLVKSYLWMEWDPISSLLYFITISDQNETEVQNKIAQGAKTVDVLCEFKCRSFVDPRKPIRLSNFEFTLTITIPVESLLNRKDHYEHYPWRNGHCSPDTTLLFKVIRLSNNGICLCQQIPPSQQTPSTTVILYILHHHAKFTFNVPENHCKHRAFFSSLYDYLMVYIPGYCIHLIDCSMDFGPRCAIQLWNDIPELSSSPHSSNMAIALSPGLLLNLRKGIVSRFDLNYKKLLTCCELGDSVLLKELVRLSSVHFPENNMSKDLLHVEFTDDTAKEYIFGHAISKCREFVPAMIKFLPNTNKKYEFCERLREIILHNQSLSSPCSTHHSSSPPAPSTPTPVFSLKRQIMNLFVSSRDTSALDSVVDSIQETDLVHSTSRTAFTDAVTEYLLMTKEYKQQRNKAYKVAYEYTNVMVDILQDLFNLVKSSDVDMTCQFQKCEVLYSLCEETSFPIPKDFTDFFSGLGFKILPRNSFYQYIRRDVFKVTENLLNKVLGDSVASANESLMCLMFKKRKEKDIKTEMKYYEKLCFGLPVMIEHFHSIMKPGVCYFHET